MKKPLTFKMLLLVCLVAVVSCNSGPSSKPVDTSLSNGPENGSLLVVGGNMRDTAIIMKFIELAGGKDAPIVIIPTASGAEEFDEERVARLFTSAGATDVKVVHTYDTAVANTDEFIEPIINAAGVWFNGGRQWRLVDAYGGTKAETEFRKVLERGGVIGGSSAGATIQGSYLARGDTKTNTIMMGDHESGFGYLANTAIDQHLLVRNRQHDLVEVIRKHPSLLGIGLDENTAIVVSGNEFEVMGESFVAIYDYSIWDENPYSEFRLPNQGKFFLLRSGDRYNLKTREVISWSGGNTRNIFAETTEDN